MVYGGIKGGINEMDGYEHQDEQCQYGESKFPLSLFVPVSVSHRIPSELQITVGGTWCRGW